MNVRSSKTHQSEDLTNDALAYQWKSLPLKQAKEYVNRLQTRIAKAVQQRKYRLAKRLQYLLTHSFFAKVLAVKTVTENKGKDTPGIDGELWLNPEQKMKAAHQLSSKQYRSKPLKRVFIPKPGSDKCVHSPSQQRTTEPCKLSTLWLSNLGLRQRRIEPRLDFGREGVHKMHVYTHSPV